MWKVIAVGVVCFLVGCTATTVAQSHIFYDGDYTINVYCDTEKGVEYIRFDYGGSVRYNKDGAISTCR